MLARSDQVEQGILSPTNRTGSNISGPGPVRVIPVLGFSETERKLSRYDGGCELDELRALEEHERTDAQREFLETEQDAEWLRPSLTLRDISGQELSTLEKTGSAARESVYSKRLSEFAVYHCPDYRRHASLKRLHSEASDDTRTDTPVQESRWS